MLRLNGLWAVWMAGMGLAACNSFAPDYSPLAAGMHKTEQLLNQETPDFSAGLKVYQEKLSGFVLQADSASHDTIMQVVNDKSHPPQIRAQIIISALYQALYKGFNHTLERISVMRQLGWYEYEVKKLTYIYEALSPLVVRMGEWFGRGPEMDETCWITLKSLLPFPYSVRAEKAAGTLREIVLHTYLLYITYQLEEMEAVCATDTSQCQKHRLAAQLVFNALIPEAQNDTVASGIAQGLKQPFSAMDLNGLRSSLRQAFPTSIERVSVSFKK